MNTITELGAAGRGDAAAFEAAIGDEVWRHYMLEAVERIAPACGSQVAFEVRHGGALLCSGDTIRAFVERASGHAEQKRGRAAVVGDLKKIDFVANQMTLRRNATGRELVCSYQPEVENSLLEHPREPILVFGTVTGDDQGRPRSIDAVDHIEPVDLSDVTVTRIALPQGAIEPSEPLVASVTFNEDDVLYEAVIEPLSIRTFAETREELASAVQDEIAAAWSIYTAQSDDRLTDGAQPLKARLQEMFRNIPNAA